MKCDDRLIWVVLHHESLREQMVDTVREIGCGKFRIVEFKTMEQALDELENHPTSDDPDLIVAGQWLRSDFKDNPYSLLINNSRLNPIPRLLILGPRLPHWLSREMSAFPKENFLTIPFHIKELMSYIENLLEKAQMRASA